MGIKAWMVKPFNKEKFLYAISKLVKWKIPTVFI
jgi:hypothetical protein